jgi:hypothetical protein
MKEFLFLFLFWPVVMEAESKLTIVRNLDGFSDELYFEIRYDIEEPFFVSAELTESFFYLFT